MDRNISNVPCGIYVATADDRSTDAQSDHAGARGVSARQLAVE